ncbi:uncharacterized protein EKO05_0006777 [Ascochyta rabiei]|uniref:uncharacterized protein n=1 Tax=Didymella rabiei TaxID=5454 RepID=UPI0022033F2E|nr:uncharacterized protein EKO05_0006777 [Ascochyta rabiei]UPX16369.1 hypothetical protein EKO05_0006777 [Ascochyta rabiei]
MPVDHRASYCPLQLDEPGPLHLRHNKCLSRRSLHHTAHIIHHTSHIAHYTLHITHCTSRIAHHALHITHCTSRTAHHALHITHCTSHIVTSQAGEISFRRNNILRAECLSICDKHHGPC